MKINSLFISCGIALVGFVLGAVTGCRRDVQSAAELAPTIQEGKGIVGFCQIGQEIRNVENPLNDLRRLHYNGDKYNPWMVYASERTRIFLDAEGRGTHARIRRIAIHFPLGFRIVTQRGLVIPATGKGTVLQVERVYGPVERTFGANISTQLVQLTETIRNGIPYLLISQDGQSEYRHYPKEGISFYCQTGQVQRCYIDPVNDRPVWTF